MLRNTYIDFQIIETNTCQTLGIVDTSYYNPDAENSGFVLQVIVPGYDEVRELNYYPSGVTILNSNLLSITNVSNYDDVVDLPDGVYTIKLSVCPYDLYFMEKSVYRTCKLDCKYSKAVLELDFETCTDCFSVEKVKKLQKAKIYIEGVKANMINNNMKMASKLYSKADSLLQNILDCDC